jgi:hypothetical protein
VLYGYHRTLDAVTSSNNGEETLCFVYLVDYTDPSKPEVLRRSTLMLFDGTIDKIRCDAMEDLLLLSEATEKWTARLTLSTAKLIQLDERIDVEELADMKRAITKVTGLRPWVPEVRKM